MTDQGDPDATGESIGIHEGPRGTALLADREPHTSALVPTAESRLQPSGKILYSKGAAILAMLHDLLDSAAPGSFQVCCFPGRMCVSVPSTSQSCTLGMEMGRKDSIDGTPIQLIIWLT